MVEVSPFFVLVDVPSAATSKKFSTRIAEEQNPCFPMFCAEVLIIERRKKRNKSQSGVAQKGEMSTVVLDLQTLVL